MAALFYPAVIGISDQALKPYHLPDPPAFQTSLKKPPGRGGISVFSLTLTERCNWRCRYCYQRRGTRTLNGKILDKACSTIFPFLSSSPLIQFYGGEPLLAFNLIRRAVARLERENRNSRKRLGYVLTTNGALLSPEILSFLNAHRFELLLSFDGPAQETERQKGSFRILSSLLDDLPRYPHIRPAVNSVFGPRTVGLLSKSVALIAERNLPNMLLSFDLTVSWSKNSLARLSRELRSVREYMLRFPRSGRTVPLVNFRRPAASGVFGCSAGRDRLALAPDGRLWGCYYYIDFYRAHPTMDVSRRYCFGTVGDFVRNKGALDADVLAHYGRGRMDWAETPERSCGICRHLESCAACPAAAALKSGKIGMIPVALCRINRILIRQRELLWKKASESGN